MRMGVRHTTNDLEPGSLVDPARWIVLGHQIEHHCAVTLLTSLLERVCYQVGADSLAASGTSDQIPALSNVASHRREVAPQEVSADGIPTSSRDEHLPIPYPALEKDVPCVGPCYGSSAAVLDHIQVDLVEHIDVLRFRFHHIERGEVRTSHYASFACQTLPNVSSPSP